MSRYKIASVDDLIPVQRSGSQVPERRRPGYRPKCTPEQQGIRDRLAIVGVWSRRDFTKPQQDAIVLFVATGWIDKNLPREFRLSAAAHST